MERDVVIVYRILEVGILGLVPARRVDGRQETTSREAVDPCGAQDACVDAVFLVVSAKTVVLRPPLGKAFNDRLAPLFCKRWSLGKL